MSTAHTTLHHRSPNPYTTVPTSSTSTSASAPAAPMSATSSILRSTEITSSTLLKSNPIHHSKIFKLKIPFIYTILPTPLLTILQFCIYPLLLLCNIKLKPYWVERYFILIGNYIYKFQPNSSGSMGKNDMKMKGSPIPLQSMTVSSLEQTTYGIITPNHNQNTNSHDSGDMMDVTIPIQMNCNGYLKINSNSKTSYYATTTQLDAQTWINVLRDARQECITYNMGHSKRPIGKEVEYVNMMGKRIIDQKQRISDLIRKRELEEVELICLDGGGAGSGGLPRGYFG